MNIKPLCIKKCEGVLTTTAWRLIYIFIFALVMIFVLIGFFSHFTFSETWPEIHTNLIFVESSYRDYVRSHKDAHGRYQITRPVLIDFNNFNRLGLTFSIKDLYIRDRAAVIYHWQIRRLKKQFNNDRVKVVNSYFMGATNTARGLYNLRYLRDIIPVETAKYLKGKQYTWVRGNIFFISSNWKIKNLVLVENNDF